MSLEIRRRSSCISPVDNDALIPDAFLFEALSTTLVSTMLRRWTIRSRSLLLLVPLCLPIASAYAQEALDNPDPAPAPIASLELSAAEAAQLSLALTRHDYTTAEKLLIGEINQSPHSARAARLLSFAGSVYFLDHDYLNAAIAWKKSEAIAALDPSAQFSLAMVYIRGGRPEWARPVLQRLASAHPEESLYPYWLGRLDYDAQQYNSAIGHFEHALTISPKMWRAYDNLGLCYFYQNKAALAIESYTKAIELDRTSPQPSAWPHLNLAIALLFLNRLDEAEAHLREALKLDPTLAPAQYQLGLVLEAENHFDLAAGAFHEAARLDTTYAEPHLALARIYRKQGAHEAAGQEVKRYLQLHSAAKKASDAQPLTAH